MMQVKVRSCCLKVLCFHLIRHLTGIFGTPILLTLTNTTRLQIFKYKAGLKQVCIGCISKNKTDTTMEPLILPIKERSLQWC